MMVTILSPLHNKAPLQHGLSPSIFVPPGPQLYLDTELLFNICLLDMLVNGRVYNYL